MERILWTYAAIVLAGIAGVGGYEWIRWAELEASDWAAWVQAIGSIAAIGVAIWVSADQHRKEIARDIKKERAEQDALVLQFHLVVEDLQRFLSGIFMQVQSRRYERFIYDASRIADIRELLREIPFAKLDKWTLARAYEVKGILDDIHVRFAQREADQDNRAWPQDLIFLQDKLAEVRAISHASNKTLVEREINISKHGKTWPEE